MLSTQLIHIESDKNANWVQNGHIIWLPSTQPLFTPNQLAMPISSSYRRCKRHRLFKLLCQETSFSVFFLKFPFKLVWVRNLPTLENHITIFCFIISICFWIMPLRLSVCGQLHLKIYSSIKLLNENGVNITIFLFYQ